MDVCSDITNEVAQNGRRGALMLSLSINHPDIEEFITKKQDLTKVTGANISVKVTDEFMRAVENDEDYIASFDNISDICRYKQLEVNIANTQAIKNLLWVALQKKDHRTRMLDGRLMHVYLVDIYDNDEE